MSDTQKMFDYWNKKYPISLMDDGITVTAVGILQFAHLDQPRKSDDPTAKPRHDCAVILHPAADVTPLSTIARKAWTESPISAKRKTPKTKGLKLQAEMHEAEWPGFGTEGCFINAMTTRMVEAFGIELGPDGQLKRVAADKFYNGCIVRLKVRAYAFDKEAKGNWGCGYSLEGIQFLSDGEKLGTGGSSGNASDGFEAAAPAGAGPAKMPNGAAAGGMSAEW